MSAVPVTHGGTPRGYMLCRCSACHKEEQCTPHRDFYTTRDDNGPLLCEDCFAEYVRETTGNPMLRQ